MKFFIRIKFRQGHTQHSCPDSMSPRDYFNLRVKDAIAQDYISVELVRSPKFGNEIILQSWHESDSKTLSEQIEDMYGYKIHGFESTIDPKRSARTAKWYKSEAAAVKAATSMVKRTGNDGALVIYKAIKIVRRDDPPVLVEDIA